MIKTARLPYPAGVRMESLHRASADCWSPVLNSKIVTESVIVRPIFIMSSTVCLNLGSGHNEQVLSWISFDEASGFVSQ